MQYPISRELSLPELANPKYDELTRREIEKDGRVIGGDKGDLYFRGFILHDDKTILYKPVLHTSLEGLTDDEVEDIASEILYASYESIGIETVEHS